MASAIGTALISTILPPMAAKAMAMVVDKVDDIVNIKREIDELQKTLRTIEGIVQVTEEKQIDDVDIRNWLSDLVDIGYDARDVLDDFNLTFPSCDITAEEAPNPVNFICSLMLCCLGGSSSDTSKLPLAILNRLEKDIRSVRERFDEKKKEGETFATLKSVVGEGSESIREYRRPEVRPFINKQRDGPFLGREEVKLAIMEKLLHPSDDDRVHVVAIWGMGGIGKTTLAQLIYNDYYPTKNRRWMCVGENKFSAEKVIMEIVNDKKTIGIGNLQKKLVQELRRERFLIVLDDVWDVDRSEWDLLFNPLTNVGKGGSIIITTRKSEVCTAINAQTTYDLKLLSEQDSWSIFEKYAYNRGNFDSTPDQKCIGKKIVKKLNGLPLALKVVGCSLLEKDSSTWTNFLESNDWMLIGDGNDNNNIRSTLRWSYNHLSRHLKTCFTYCALFPKDHVFDNEKVLVEMWMAHDLIQKEKQKRPEDVGAQYFQELVNASLLQCVDGKYVMHDLIHDLAEHVSNGEFATANGSLSIDQIERVRHITITPRDYSKIPRLCNIEKLLTLYTTDDEIYPTEKFDDSVLDDVFNQLKSIRVLVLVSSEITDIPDCISKLKHLRYLDVSRTSVRSLPDSLCHLYHLQVLAAPPSAVLPRDIVNMVNLRYVRGNLSTCKGIGKLTSLQELSSIHVCEGDNIRELGGMQILRGKLTIQGLENVEELEDDVGFLMEKQTLMDELELVFDGTNWGLYWYFRSTISAQVLDALGCPPNLNYLKIAGHNGLEPPSWMVDGRHKFDKLQTLELSDYPFSKMKSLPPLGELPSLKHLSLRNVGMKSLGDKFYGKFSKSKVFFPSLESLRFSQMLRWKGWDNIIIENSSVSFFPRLTRLEIQVCPQPVSVLPVVKNGANFMSSLSSLKICDCEGLKRLQLDALVSLKELEISSCKSLVQILHSAICLAATIERIHLDCERLRISDCGLPERMDFERLPSLESLKIESCGKLVSIPRLVGIKFLKLHDCESLKSLSINIHGLDSLEHLNITGCPTLELAFEDVSSSSSSSGNSVAVPISISTDNTQVFRKLLHHEFVSLESLVIEKLVGFENFGDTEANNFCKLMSLKTLCISQCKQLKSLPVDFHKLSSLQFINIDTCDQLQSLPPDFHKLSSLDELKIKSCPQLQSLPPSLGRLSSLQFLDIDSCPQLESLPPHFDMLSSLEKLKIKSCPQLQSLPRDFHKLSSLNSLRIESCAQLESLPPSFGKLSCLQFLNIDSCKQLQSLPIDFHKLSSLEILNIKSCPQLQSLPADFNKLSSLKILCIEVCLKIQSLPPDFHKLSSLEYLHIKSCPQLQSLPSSFGKLSSLKILKIKSCEQLQSLPPNFHKLSSLEELKIKYCPQLQSLSPSFGKLSSLEELYINDCPQLQLLCADFYKLSSLKSLRIENCPGLQSLPPDFHKLSSLKSLSIIECPQLQSLPPDFYKLSSLKSLSIIECPQLQSLLPDFHKLSSLNFLCIVSCPQHQSLTSSINSLVIAYQQPLEERCKLESGHYWHQIKHIRDIYLSTGEDNFISVVRGTLDDYAEEHSEDSL